MSDKDIEKNRYDSEAQSALDAGDLSSVNALTLPLKAPYGFYQSVITSHANSDSLILEIAAGMGENTEFLLGTGAKVYATDISEQSLSIIEKRFDMDKLTTQVADMEKLPFDDDSFNVVCNAGSLSYGDNDIVMNEIYRVLKPQGVFIAVDSLNNNPIYRLNRYIHYLKGRRSLGVINRTPDLKLLRKYEQKFSKVETKFFGSISYLTPLLIKIFGEKKTTKISNSIDKLFSIKRTAFKFVLIAEK
ncbi:hypothetical protein BAZOLSSOX_1753 [uncultured Gammaproteobacteria bacterium]|jgi:ubiquinone/menaquinone biosynthesis C-methylase UbiE|nr:hypothetical protein BAZOLSSOX_1753 [uncultured Gammaproteobacteria bacterium]